MQTERYDSLGAIPLIVLASVRLSRQDKRQDLQDTWLELQQELTLLSENREIRMLAGPGHYIQFDQPGVIVETVHGVQR